MANKNNKIACFNFDELYWGKDDFYDSIGYDNGDENIDRLVEQGIKSIYIICYGTYRQEYHDIYNINPPEPEGYDLEDFDIDVDYNENVVDDIPEETLTFFEEALKDFVEEHYDYLTDAVDEIEIETPSFDE